MESLYKWILVLSAVQAVNASCEIVFEDEVSLRNTYETTEYDGDELPDKFTFEATLATDEEPILAFDLELDQTEDNCANSSTGHMTKQCKYQHKGSDDDIVVGQAPDYSYQLQGEILTNMLSWAFSPANAEVSGIHNAHLLSVKRCSNERDSILRFPKKYTVRNKSTDEVEDRTARQQRHKRSLQTYTVELLMVIDNAVYSWWKHLEPSPSDASDDDVVENIQQYYAYVLKEIDNRFISMEQDLFEINIAFSGMIIANTDEESFWTTTSIVEGEDESVRTFVNSSEALEKFQQWLDNNTDLPQYDHAILFTGSDLIYAGNPGNTGLAFEASMCRNISNSSIVEESFDARTITYAVRQIARSLGVRDDMDNNDCLEFFNFIMAPKFKLPIKSFPANRWLFSTCSVQYFKEYIDSLNEVGLNCLDEVSLQKRFPMELTQRVEDLPGKYYDAKEQCVNRFGIGSDICRADIGRKYSKLCSGLQCTVPGNDVCETILPADGTPCGNMKYCFGGECAEFEDAEPRLDTCVFGNQPGEGCEMHISGSPVLCYNQTLNHKCCLSCSAREIGLPNCEYGNRIQGCSEDQCSSQSELYTQTECCLTCLDGSISYLPPIANFLTTMISEPTDQSDGDLRTQASTSIFTSSVTGYVSYQRDQFGTVNTKTPLSIEPSLTTGSATTKSLEERRNEFGSSNVKRSTPKAAPAPSSTAEPSVVTNLITTQKLKELSTPMNPTTMLPTNDDISQAVPSTKVSQLPPVIDGESEIILETSTSTRIQTGHERYDKTTKPPATSQTPTVECITKKKEKLIPQSVSKLSTPPPASPTDSKTNPTTKASQTKTEPLNTPPVSHIYKGDTMLTGSMTIYDRIFFKELARSMRRNQRVIRQSVQQSFKYIYASVSHRIGGFQETENENEFSQANNLMGETRSNDDDDLNRKLKPVWQRQYRLLVRELEMNIKRMRYNVLMMVNRHLRQ